MALTTLIEINLMSACKQVKTTQKAASKKQISQETGKEVNISIAASSHTMPEKKLDSLRRPIWNNLKVFAIPITQRMSFFDPGR